MEFGRLIVRCWRSGKRERSGSGQCPQWAENGHSATSESVRRARGFAERRDPNYERWTSRRIKRSDLLEVVVRQRPVGQQRIYGRYKIWVEAQSANRRPPG